MSLYENDLPKMINILKEQRKTGKFCDLKIELDSGAFTWGHFCILAPQIDFIGGPKLLETSLYFSIQNPLKIKVYNFECVECLNTMMDYCYSSRPIDITNEHEEHLKSLAKMLCITELKNLHDDDFDIIESDDSEKFNEDNLIIETIAKNSRPNYYRINSEENINYNDDMMKEDTLKLSAKRNHYNKFYHCPGCSFQCHKTEEMIQHLAICKSDSMICNLCDVGFYSADDFYVHLENHQDKEKPFCCLECDQKFTTKTILQLHMPKHSLDSKYQCQHCPKRFKWRSSADSHALTHSDPKLLCDICGQSAVHMKALRSHKLTHADEYLKCSFVECSYKTSRKENLKKHTETHKNVQPFVCEKCGKKFSQAKNLKRHYLLHSDNGKGSLKCPEEKCFFATHRTDKLKEHISKNHPSIKENNSSSLEQKYDDLILENQSD